MIRGRKNASHTRTEERWPCQRLRMAFSLILFFFFEVLIGKKLPEPIPFLALGLGLVAFASAVSAIREWKLAMQLVLIQDALERRR